MRLINYFQSGGQNLFLIALITFLSGCNTSPNDNSLLEVGYASFGDEIELIQNLSFTFNQQVLKEDTLLNK